MSKIIKSPLRYPGGKGLLYNLLSDTISINNLSGTRYYEPFAGGAGLGLALLSTGKVSEFFLNDIDYHIYCFWVAVFNNTAMFTEKVLTADISLKEWYKQKRIYDNPRGHSPFNVGFSTFYLNRCNRSGILSGAGPIGGFKQNGKWKMDARFNKDSLVKRIHSIGEMRNYVKLENKDAILFLKEKLPLGKKRKNTLVYIDPPYVSSGKKLYYSSYSHDDHRFLANYLLKQKVLKWVLTYDNSTLIKKLYANCTIEYININYSAQTKRKGKEVIISPNCIKIPINMEG